MTFLFIFIVVVIVFGLASQTEESQNEHDYTATFGDPYEYFGSMNHGFAVGSVSTTRAFAHTNSAIYGATGSGKTVKIIVPTLISLARGKSSIVVNDVSGGELFKLTSQYFQRKGYKVLRYNFSDEKQSEQFNPLDDIRTINDAQKLSLILIRNTIGETKSDPFFENSSIMIIALFIRYLVFHTEKKYHTMQNVLRLVETFATDGKAVSKLILATRDEALLQNYKATIVMGERTLQSVIATARTALSLWNSNSVCKTTSGSSLDFQTLRDIPTIIYVTTPLKDIEYLKPLCTMFFQAAFNFVLTQIPPKNSRSIFFVLEESGTMTFPNIANTISNVRKFSSGIMLCMQDQDCLIAQYGSAVAHQLNTNCGLRVYLPGQPLHTCKELSQILGKYSYGDNGKSRELLTVDEVRMCPDPILILSNSAPLRLETKPYYESIWYSHLANAKPLLLPQTIIEEPPLIPLS